MERKVLTYLYIVQVSMYHALGNHARISRSAEESFDGQCSLDNLKSEQLTGDCRMFQHSPCLCALNRNCEYDESAKSCVKITDCSLYDNNAVDCRNNHCFYECGTGSCSRNRNEYTCDDSECTNSCSDICQCVGSGCEYDTKSGKCKSVTHMGCPEAAFTSNECGRVNGIYHKDGTYCKNVRERGDCSIEKVILAVNLNGENLTDSDGIQYIAGKMIDFEDKDKVLLTYNIDNDLNVRQEEQELYKSGIYGDSTKRQPGRCVTFYVSICEEGNFQLVIKTMEISDSLVGEKSFNIRLGNHYIFPEVDIAKLSRGSPNPVELAVNFHVKHNVIIIPGQVDIPIYNRRVQLSFCFGMCTFTEGSFHIGSFSIVKFHTKNNADCAKYYHSDWECAMAKCHYNELDKTCMPYLKESTCVAKPITCGYYEQAKHASCPTPTVQTTCHANYDEAHIQMHFAMDRSGGVDHPNEAVIHLMSSLIYEIKEAIDNIHPSSEFSFSTHVNYPGTVFAVSEPGHVLHNQLPEGCYEHLVPFAKDVKLISQAASKIKGVPGVQHLYGEASLPAMAFAVVDRTNGWNRNTVNSNGKRMYHFLVVAADEDSILSLDFPGNRTDFRFDGTDSCSTTKPPTYKLYNEIFTRNTINVIGLHRGGKKLPNYVNHFKQIGTPYCGRGFDGPKGFKRDVVKLIVDCVKELTSCMCTYDNS